MCKREKEHFYANDEVLEACRDLVCRVRQRRLDPAQRDHARNTDRLPEGEKHNTLNAQQFALGVNALVVILQGVVEQNQTVHRPLRAESDTDARLIDPSAHVQQPGDK